MRTIAIWALGGAVLAGGVAHAADPAKSEGQQCFRSSSYQSFRDIDEHAMNIRVNMRDFYRIELAGGCPELTDPGASLITRVRGSDLICGPLDWDLRVRQGGPGGIAAACIVTGQRKLSPEEVAAMPPKEKP